MIKTPKLEAVSPEKELVYWQKQDLMEQSEPLGDDFSLTNLKPSTSTITVRVPQHLLTNLKLIANKRDIPYQSLLKVYLQEKVREEMQTPFLRLQTKKTRLVVSSLVGLMVTAGFLYAAVVQPIQAVGESMAPNYPTNTYYLMDKVSTAFGVINRGDVVVFHSPSDSGAMHFKRVIGLPGDKVRINKGTVEVNREVVAEPYVVGTTQNVIYPLPDQELTVPGNSVYVLGDNREKSTDSRHYGFVNLDTITGKVGSCYWNCE